MEGDEESGWGALPHVPLLKVLEYLDRKDRLAASSVCHQWRGAAFQLPLGDKLTLNIQRETDIPRAEFLINTFGRKVPEVTLRAAVDTSSGKIAGLLERVLDVLQGNRILRSLKVVPAYSSTSSISNKGGVPAKDLMESLSKKVKQILEARNLLECVGWPGSLAIESFEEASPSKKSRIHSLFLTSLPRQHEQESQYVGVDLWMKRLRSFEGLQVLSLNFSVLSDDILRLLGTASNVGGLKQLNLLALEDNQAISNAGWIAFVLNNEQARVRFTVAGNADVGNLLYPAIPISHFRVISSCTTRILDVLVQWNQATLEVLEVGGQKASDVDVDVLDEAVIIDPFVFAAWKCHRLHSIRIGFKYCGEDLLGIARLKGSSLVRLDILRAHVDYPCRSKLIEMVSEALGRSWRPEGAGRKRRGIKNDPLDEILNVIEQDEI